MRTFEYQHETFIDTYDFTDPKYQDKKGLVITAEAQFDAYAAKVGAEGWELVSVLKTSSISGFTAFFKRTNGSDGEVVTGPSMADLLKSINVATLQSHDVPSKRQRPRKSEDLVVGPANPSGDPK